jgi:hypothetical protein
MGEIIAAILWTAVPMIQVALGHSYQSVPVLPK